MLPYVYEFMTNYNLSIIMPFYKKLEEIKFTLPLNYKYFVQNGVEIIFVVDEPLTIEDFEFLNAYENLKYKIIVNNNKHEWRNPTKVINVGIRHANKDFNLVMSPESIFTDNVIEMFRKSYRKKSFVVL